jgi:predicted Zn-dependent peptidase
MDKKSYPAFHTEVYTETLDNGLTVYLLPKPGFRQVYAAFTTKYGSIDSVFKTTGEEEFRTVPDGIAHFLEHKMFEEEEGDVFTEFAAHGASANAFTSFDQTTYLFSCTDEVLENTSTLLDFVQRPYFTEENVEKEKGIIGQEIRMYDDNPDWRGFFDLLRALFASHPVRIDIAGTVESIAKIDRDTLYHCYHTFYHPSNMIFVASGGFEVEAMMATIRANQAAKTFPPAPQIERKYPQEPEVVAKEKTVAHLSVVQPRCLVGFKDRQAGLSGRTMLEQELLTGVILDTLFGRSSNLYDELLQAELVDQAFTWEYEITPHYGYALVGGNTAQPDEVLQRLDVAIQHAVTHGLEEADFERSRKKAIGRFMASLDQVSYVARTYTSYQLKDADLFDTVDILEGLSLQLANQRVQDFFRVDGKSVSLVLPKAQ